MALGKFLASNLLTNPPHGTCSRFLNTRSIANVFLTASYFVKDSLHVESPVRMMRVALKKLESGILRPADFHGRWMVRQNTEALLVRRYTSKNREEEVKVSVERNSYAIFGPWNQISKNLGTEPNTLDHDGLPHSVNKSAVLLIACKLPLGYFEGGKAAIDTYALWIDLQCDLYITDAIIIEESNQVLKITVPKLKPDWIHKGRVRWDYGSSSLAS